MLVWNFSVSTLSACFSSSRPHSAIGPSFGCRPKNTSSVIGAHAPAMRAVGALDVDAARARRLSIEQRRAASAFDVAHAARRRPARASSPPRRARRGTPRAGARASRLRALPAKLEHPVERGIAAAEDHQVLAVKLGGVRARGSGCALPSNVSAPGDAEAPRLERADAGGDDDRAGIETRAGDGLDVEAAVLARAAARSLPGRGGAAALNGSICLQQAVDELLRPAHRQRRDVVDRLVRIQLRALAARVRAASRPRARVMPSRPSSNTWNSPQGPAPMMTTSVTMGAARAALVAISLKAVAYGTQGRHTHCRGSEEGACKLRPAV